MASVGLEIAEAEIARIRRRPTVSLNAYDALMRGLHELMRFTPEGFERARPWYERAIELDPEFAPAYAGLGASYILEYIRGWNLDPSVLDRARELSERALELDPKQPQALNTMGAVLLLRDRPTEARVYAEKTLAADPNWNIANLAIGMHQAREGQLLDAIRSANRALRLNPRAPSGELISIAYLKHRVGHTEEAVEMWERARAENPDEIFARVGLAGVYQSRGRHAEARAEVQEILRVNPDLTAELVLRSPIVGFMMDAKTRAQLRDQLRSAGLP